MDLCRLGDLDAFCAGVESSFSDLTPGGDLSQRLRSLSRDVDRDHLNSLCGE